MLTLSFYALTALSPAFNGKQGSMQMAGSFVMTSIVIVSNVKLLLSTFEITVWLNLLVIASIIVYFVSFWWITWYSPVVDDFGIFYELFENALTYVALIFFMSSYVLIDTGMRYASLEMKVILERRKDRSNYEAKLKALKNPKKNTAVQKRISNMSESK